MRVTGIILSVVGLIAIVFGAVWTTTVFPRFEKIPSDYSQTVDFQGTYAILEDQDFLQQLLVNPSIQQILASPDTMALLADPSVLQFLAGPELKALLADPATMQQLMANSAVLQEASDPSVKQALADPAVRRLLADPEALQAVTSPSTLQLLANPLVLEVIATPGALAMLADPLVQQLLADPAAAMQSEDPAVQQLLADATIRKLVADPTTLALLLDRATQELLASPVVGQILAEPAILQALANPTIQQLLADPTLLGLLTNPAVQPLLDNPAAPRLLSDPVVKQLLADPTALSLLVDARTVRLLADPTNLPMAQFPVSFHRVREAERTEGDVLFLHQDFTATLLGTQQKLDQFSSVATLAVDRSSRVYVPGGSEPRRGGFAFPFDVKKDQEYAIWVHEVFQPLTARFVETDEVEGLKVFTFSIREEGMAIPADLTGGLPATADVEMTTKTEPKSGITIDVASQIRYRLVGPQLGNPTIFEGEIRYSDESILTSVDDARDARTLLFWLGSFLPWSAMGLGIFLVVVGASLVGWTVARRGKATT